MIYNFDTLGSTNTEARENKYTHGDIIVADHQSNGRGQRGNKWSSRKGENLTFTVVWDTSFVAASEQFALSMCVALALHDALLTYGIDSQIKWTNDIYVFGRKICGVLIEHDLSGTHLSRTIVGIGLNVNQTEFDPSLPNPTSMSIQTGSKYDRKEVLDVVDAALKQRYRQLYSGGIEQIVEQYNDLLYRRDSLHRFAYPSGEQFDGIIRNVQTDGCLGVEIDGEVKQFLFKQIEYVIEKDSDQK